MQKFLIMHNPKLCQSYLNKLKRNSKAIHVWFASKFTEINKILAFPNNNLMHLETLTSPPDSNEIKLVRYQLISTGLKYKGQRVILVQGQANGIANILKKAFKDQAFANDLKLDEYEKVCQLLVSQPEIKTNYQINKTLKINRSKQILNA